MLLTFLSQLCTYLKISGPMQVLAAAPVSVSPPRTPTLRDCAEVCVSFRACSRDFCFVSFKPEGIKQKKQSMQINLNYYHNAGLLVLLVLHSVSGLPYSPLI